jgi:uncharacterized membrane protein YqhA
MKRQLTPRQNWIERTLLAVRFVFFIPVFSSVLLALGAVYLATIDAIYVLAHLANYVSGATAPATELRVKLLTAILKAFDTYLIAAVLLIFAIGLYELFISRIETEERSELAGRLLFVEDLDDLKNRLAKLVLLVLVVEVLQQGLQLTYRNALDVLYLAIATLLVGGAVFLGNYIGGHREPEAGVKSEE